MEVYIFSFLKYNYEVEFSNYCHGRKRFYCNRQDLKEIILALKEVFVCGWFCCIMGCACCKPSAIDDSKESPRERFSSKASLDLRVARATSSRREEAYRAKDRYDSNDGRTMLLDKQTNGFVALHGEDIERKREKMECVVAQYPGMGSLPKASEGEQIAAGWPSWLAAVAGEAIRGWVPRRADSFEKLDKVCSLIQFSYKIVLMLQMFVFILMF